ncbi:MAG TPA: LPS export ABC transporter permease LptG [Nitrospiria bacterium]|nr:LPS export ABC transporter permease LptG [Nitrospiria bacterium]HUK56480.1 LPS export ABC transporter permease LptG [Nitrospiria bacterium]
MPILLKYIFREYIKILLLCLAMLVLVYTTIDFFSKIGRLIQENASFPLILLYFGLKIPKTVFDVAPIAMLVATLIHLGLLSRHNEIVAMKSNGVSLLYATAPILILAFALSLFLGLCNLSFVPLTRQKTDFVRFVKIKKFAEQAYYGQSQLWLRDGRHTFLNIRLADPINRVLHDVTIYKVRDDFTLEERIEAKRIQYENGTWTMYQGRALDFLTDGNMTESSFEKQTVALERKPKEFKGLDIDTDKMKFKELNRYIKLLDKDGYDVRRYRVDLYNKVSLPFVNFVMSLMAIPFGLVETRSRGIARGVGISLLIGSCYWIVLSIALALGHAGLIPPFLAGGTANVLFLAVGLYLYLGIRQ